MLPIDGPMIAARFLRKRDRFTAIVALPEGETAAHLPTSSRMRELLAPGARVLVARREAAHRATGHDLLMAYLDDTLVSVDSRVPNRLLEIALRGEMLAEFAGWSFARREVTLGESRLDFLLTRQTRRCWVEAKSVTLVRDGVALFPDAPTARGARHLGELTRAVSHGDRAAAVFIIQRPDADSFSPNRAMDPVFARALEDAAVHGVEIFAFRCRVTPEEIAIAARVPLRW